MIQKVFPTLLFFVFAAGVFAPERVFSAESTDALEILKELPTAKTPAGSAVKTNSAPGSVLKPIEPGPEDGLVAFITARLLEQMHYSREPFSNALSSRFLDVYIESLDPQRLHFLQADLAEFEGYRHTLDDLTINRRGAADTTPGFQIFQRFVERLQQRVEYSQELLKGEPFQFDTDERVAINRRELPNPRTVAEARDLWRQRLRYEYLQEKLGHEARKREAALKPGTATNGVAAAANAADNAGTTNAPRSRHEEIVDTLSHRYVRTLKVFTDYNNEDVLDAYLSALAQAFDPHSDYFNGPQLESFRISMNLQLFGIGAELRAEDGYCRIERLLPGGPAEKSKKIKPGDRIVAVAQADQTPVDIVDMSLNKAVQLIRGPKNTEVRLTIIPSGASSSTREEISLIRDEIQLEDSAAKGRIIEIPDPASGKPIRLGVIDLPSFYHTMPLGQQQSTNSQPRSTTDDVTKLLKKFKEEGVGGVILDLRRNGGGALEEAIRLTGLFIKEGPVVQAKNWDDSVRVDRDTDSAIVYEGPLVVLTSRFSASASEILAGALQDYNRAVIVGNSATHGKGTVQTVQNLIELGPFRRRTLVTQPGAVKVTISKFYRASGASTQKRGVIPDIVLPSVLNYSKDIGEAAMDNALEWDTTDPVPFEKLDLVQSYLPELLRRSTERVATNQEFVYVREDIEQFRKQQEDKTVSLNEQTRLKEMDEAEARLKARVQERKGRNEPDLTTYEITLKQAELPGLPAPLQKTNRVADAAMSAATNTVAGTGSTPTDPEEEAEDEAGSAVDAVLLESQRILVDYIKLFPRAGAVAVTTETKERQNAR